MADDFTVAAVPRGEIHPEPLTLHQLYVLASNEDRARSCYLMYRNAGDVLALAFLTSGTVATTWDEAREHLEEMNSIGLRNRIFLITTNERNTTS